MAVTSICALLANGYDGSCIAPARKYYQQAVLINKTDIDPASVTYTLPDTETGACSYTVAFDLKAGKTGYRITGAEAGNSFFGSFDKSRTDAGYTQYIHNVQIFVGGLTEASKCILAALDKGSFVVALQLTDGTVEIYGMGSGLSTGDYTFNIVEGGGGSVILLSSLEDAPEGNLPMIYESAVPGQENEDFDDAFAVGS